MDSSLGNTRGTEAWMRAADRTAGIAAIFCLIVFVFLLGNMVRSRAVEPTKPVALEKKMLDLNRDPKNEALKTEVRRLDREVRSAWFNGRAFAVKGFYLLIGGVVVFLMAIETSQALRRSAPVPRPDAVRESWAAAAVSRRSVAALGTVGAGVLVLIAVVSRHDAAAEYARAADREFRQMMAQPNPAAVSVAPRSGGAPESSTTTRAPVSASAGGTSSLPAPSLPGMAPSSQPMPVTGPNSSPSAIPVGGDLRAAPNPSPSASSTTKGNLSAGVRRLLAGPAHPAGWDAGWPVFRGPSGVGIASSIEIPAKFEAGKGQGLLWKSDVPLPGWNSPVVWGSRVFLTGASKTAREIYCYNADAGALAWTRAIPWPKGGPGVKVMEGTGYAPSTGAVDGKRFFAAFVNGEVVCLDFAGRLLWTRSLGLPDNGYGHAASLALYGNGLIVQLDQGEAKAGKSRMLALDASSGQTVWETARPVGSSWSTPVIARIGGKEQIVTCADPWVIAYEPASGRELWRAECLRGEIVASASACGQSILVCTQGAALSAIRPHGSGDVTKTGIAWKYEEDLPDIASPVSDGGLVYLATSDGLVVCVDARTGKKVWDHVYQASFHASPVLAGERLVLLDSKGAMFVLEAGRQFKEVAQGVFGEDVEATPAFARGRMFVRGAKRLYCVGVK